MPLVTFYVDNKAVVDGMSRGEEWCTRSGFVGAGKWTEILAIIRDMDGQEVHVKKVKAHTSWWDGVLRRNPHGVHVGNAMADSAAKEAQNVSEQMSPTKSFNEQLHWALGWLKLARICASRANCR